MHEFNAGLMPGVVIVDRGGVGAALIEGDLPAIQTDRSLCEESVRRLCEHAWRIPTHTPKNDVSLKLAALEIHDLRFVIGLIQARIPSLSEISNFAPEPDRVYL